MVEASIQYKHIIPILRIIDPLQYIFRSRFTNNIDYATNLFTFDHMHSLMPNTPVVNVMLELFYTSMISNHVTKSKILCIGPVRCQLFKRICVDMIDSENRVTNPTKGLQGLLSEAENSNIFVIQMNTELEEFGKDTKGHYIVIEINFEEAKEKGEFQLFVADSLDVDANNDSIIKQWEKIITMQKLDLFLQEIRPHFIISYHRAKRVTLQNDVTECGIHGARRIFSMFRFGEVLSIENIERDLGSTRHFRLYMVQSIFLLSQEFSLLVSSTGTLEFEPTDANSSKIVRSPIKKNSFKTHTRNVRKMVYPSEDTDPLENDDEKITSYPLDENEINNIINFCDNELPDGSPKSDLSNWSFNDVSDDSNETNTNKNANAKEVNDKPNEVFEGDSKLNHPSNIGSQDWAFFGGPN
jgi:hypothetical protein